jgi:hypothetical protein
MSARVVVASTPGVAAGRAAAACGAVCRRVDVAARDAAGAAICVVWAETTAIHVAATPVIKISLLFNSPPVALSQPAFLEGSRGATDPSLPVETYKTA